MSIQEIKQNLTLATVLHYYNLKPDKNSRLNCPFHEDKTPSMQVYYKTHTAYCFSSNCKTHGKSLDVIDFIMHKENTTKHEAILKAQDILGNGQETKSKTKNQPQTKEQFLQNIFQYFKNAVHSSKPAQEYLQSRNLDFKKIEVGYNAGQFHHGTRKEASLIHQCLETGLLIDNNRKGRTGETAYTIFGKYGICFPLKNKENQITSLYFRSTLDKETDKGGSLSSDENKSQVKQNAKHFYLKNRQGLYPNYPNPATKKLILTESIIDCASLIQALNHQQWAISPKPRAESYEVLACYGTNGLNEEIQKAILDLKELEEIIFAFDNDDAGRTATAKYTQQLETLNLKLKTTTLELPGKDINETLQLHEPEIFTELLNQRKELNFSYSIEDKTQTAELPEDPSDSEQAKQKKPATNTQSLTTQIDFLKQPDLLNQLNKQIGKSGIVGEENSRLLLFLIIISYLNKSPIHAIVQGSSGSGKTHLISKIADLMPQEDVLRFTRITESSLYNYGEFDLFQKIVIIEDLDGLKEDALYALRELISNQSLSSLTSIKDKKGNSKGARKEVKGQFSSLSATTKGELYEDNMNRSFILAINESEEQTQKIIDYQNKRIAGEIDLKEAPKAVNFIQKIVRSLKAYEVQNPYASKIQLPNNVRNKRRLNEMIQSVIKQITVLNQYQRNLTADNQLRTTIDDIENAIEILFESIILKIDELDGSSRQFFEKLKKAFGDNDFTRFEAMEKTGFKKTQLQFYLNDLVRLEYLKQFGHHNKGFKYKVAYSDNNQQVRKELKTHFVQQLEDIKRTQANTTERQTNAKTL